MNVVASSGGDDRQGCGVTEVQHDLRPGEGWRPEQRAHAHVAAELDGLGQRAEHGDALPLVQCHAKAHDLRRSACSGRTGTRSRLDLGPYACQPPTVVNPSKL